MAGNLQNIFLGRKSSEGIWGRKKKNQNIEKITFKVVQMKFLAMHITNQKLGFDIFTVRHLLNIFMEHNLHLMSKWFLA